MEQPFVFMGPSHVIAIALTFATPAALTLVQRRRDSESVDRLIRYGLAAVVAVTGSPG